MTNNKPLWKNNSEKDFSYQHEIRIKLFSAFNYFEIHAKSNVFWSVFLISEINRIFEFFFSWWFCALKPGLFRKTWKIRIKRCPSGFENWFRFYVKIQRLVDFSDHQLFGLFISDRCWHHDSYMPVFKNLTNGGHAMHRL